MDTFRLLATHGRGLRPRGHPQGAPEQLVINTFGASLRGDGDRFLVRAGDKHFAVSAHRVRSILLTTAAHLSTDAIDPVAAGAQQKGERGSPHGPDL